MSRSSTATGFNNAHVSIRQSNPEAADAKGGAGEHIALLAHDQLADEKARKNSLEQRGFSLVPASAFLVTVVFGLATFSARGDELSFGIKALALIASIAFLVAAFCGLASNWPLEYREPAPYSLRRAIDESWDAEASAAARRVAEDNLRTLESAGERNRPRKSGFASRW